LFSARDSPGRLQPLLDGLLFDGNNHYVPIAANSYKKAAADFSLERKPSTSKYSLGAFRAFGRQVAVGHRMTTLQYCFLEPYKPPFLFIPLFFSVGIFWQPGIN